MVAGFPHWATKPIIRRLHVLDTPMLSSFRKFAGTWPARILFLVLVAAFASWALP